MRVLVCIMAVASLVSGQSKPQIPSHPRVEIRPARLFCHPSRAAYRHVLKNGVVAYLVEDHDLPLISISVTIRVGSYLDPAGKGRTRARGSEPSFVPVELPKWKAEEFDEDSGFSERRTSPSNIGETPGGASSEFAEQGAR